MAWPHCERSLACLHKYVFTHHPSNQFFFLHQPTSASNVIPVLSPTNVTTSSNTASCAAPVSLSVWDLPPCAPPNPLNAEPLSLSVLVGGGGVSFVTWPPSHTSDSADPLSLSVLVGGRVVLIPGTPHAPLTLLSMYVLVERYGFEQVPLAHP